VFFLNQGCIDLFRCIYIGEGAGANIVLRAASEECTRFVSLSSYQSSSSPKIKICGVILIDPDPSGPTIGNHYNASYILPFASKFFSSAFYSLCGVPSTVSSRGNYQTIMSHLHPTKYVSAYYTVGKRNRLRTKRLHSLTSIPNLILCHNDSYQAKERAEEVCDLLGKTSTVVPVPSNVSVSKEYVVGGGVVLMDQNSRKACVRLCTLFLEGI